MPARLLDGLDPAPGTARPRRVRTIRTGGMVGAVGPGIVASYTLATWNGPHRPTMLAVAGVMVAANLLTAWQAATIARSRARVTVQLTGALLNVLGSAALGLLDGGVASPLGPLVLFSLIFFAVLVPLRVFIGIFVVSIGAYWTVALLGDPVPAGYPSVFTLAFAGVSYLCVRHARTLASLRRRLTDASRIDPLTICLNRRGFDERLGQELAGAVRTGTPVTLVVIDLDRFKDINDTYGHRTGDEVLAWAGQAMLRQVRAHDAVGRLGGDEFAVILSGIGSDEAEDLVDRLRATLDPVAPASIGYASYPAEAATAHELMQRADERVYRDKAGRTVQVPQANAIAAARRQLERAEVAKVSRRERRRRSITDMGGVAVSNFGIGLGYVAFFATAAPHRLAMGVLSAVGFASGLLVVGTASWVSRSPAARWLMIAFAVVFFPVGVAIAVLDGGAGSPTILGTLVPMPLIALGTPPRVAVPILAGLSACYIAVAVVVDAPGGWYVTMHLVGIIAISVICAAQGRAAARQRALLTRLSVVDVLTDCLNRRGFEDRFTTELARTRRAGGALSLLIFDLDGFKQLNDARGHAAGDELLRWVAETLRCNLQPHDVVARLGGDEFVVLLVSACAADGKRVADRLLGRLAAQTSASVGVAALPEHGQTFDALYAHADSNLYQQKARRRSSRVNRVHGAYRDLTVHTDGAEAIRYLRFALDDAD